MSLFKKSEPDVALEKVPAGESTKIDLLVGSTIEDLQGLYPRREDCRRAVHPKDHGCVEASFTVEKLRDELRVGLFKNGGKTFRAAIRFSNASGMVERDAPLTTLGMAIKLYDVEGDRLEPDDGERTQDLLMISIPVFPFANVEDFEANSRGAFFPRPPQTVAPGSRVARSMEIVGQTRGRPRPFQPPPRSPLDTVYFSAVPYQFGKGRAMKFRARPVNPVAGPPGAEVSQENYLREALSQRMAGPGEDICFDFEVQVRDSKRLDIEADIENACTLWDENIHRFERVARIAIPRQDVSSAQRQLFCEKLFYTSWHGLKAHRPLGGINRARREVYEASSKHRGCPIPAVSLPPRRR